MGFLEGGLPCAAAISSIVYHCWQSTVWMCTVVNRSKPRVWHLVYMAICMLWYGWPVIIAQLISIWPCSCFAKALQSFLLLPDELVFIYLPANHWSHTVYSLIQLFQHSSLDMQLLQDTGSIFCIFVTFCRELSKRLNSWKRKVNLWWLYVKSAALRKILKPVILLS